MTWNANPWRKGKPLPLDYFSPYGRGTWAPTQRIPIRAGNIEDLKLLLGKRGRNA